MSEEGTSQGSRARLLLVDDNPTNLKVLHDLLKDRGHELRVARSGEQALGVAEKVELDLILLDIMMPPGIDGYETLRRLKAQPRTRAVPVIFLSALDETGDKVKGLDLGAVDYVTKPFQAAELIARVETHLTIHRLRQELERRNAELAGANRRMHRDLEAAARVQQALLPGPPPELERARLAWRYHPCAELAGDALNLHRIGDRFLVLYVLDVSGHGVPAALLSVAVTRTLLPSADPACLVVAPGEDRPASPAAVVSRLNLLFPMERNGQLYFTLAYAVLDLETGQIRFVTAGHPGPILMRVGQPPEQIHVPSPLLGILEEVDYRDTELRLEPGDRLFFFSDGLYEERNSEGRMFGMERLCDSLARSRGATLEESLDRARQEIIDFRGDDQLEDDFSILAVECTP